MDREQKFEQTQKIKNYLEKHQVRELFLNLLKQLIVSKPEKPLDFLCEKLYNPLVKRIFILGPAGSERKEYAKRIKEQFDLQLIDTSELLNKEAEKDTPEAKRIKEAFAQNVFVPDDIVIQLVKKRITTCEKECRHWIIEGFPRTKVQALALEQCGVIPDKMIVLTCSEDKTLNKLKQNLIDSKTQLSSEQEMDKVAAKCLLEYKLNIKAIAEVYKNFLFTVDTSQRAQHQIETTLIRMVGLKFNEKSPRKAPNIVILGPPGSGRTTQARLVADQFGLICVSVRDLIAEQSKKTPELGQVIKRAMISGQLLPDHLLNNLVSERISQADCQVNGWVLEGYPMSESQFNQLKALNVKPTATILLQQAEEDSVLRLKDRRVDPYTGLSYNMKLIKLQDPHLQQVLHEALKEGNTQRVAELGFGNVSQDMLDILALGLTDAKAVDVHILNRLVPAQEDSEAIVRQRYQNFKHGLSQVEELMSEGLIVQPTYDFTISKLFDEIAKKIYPQQKQ